MDKYKYVITNTGEPDSFDPLHADKWNNMPMARMLYLTPIEISPEDELTSTILKNFKYIEKEKTIIFEVNNNLHYSDGSLITVHDVAFSIARMTHRMPRFPVIKDIQGKDEWLKSKDPLTSLPKGIKINDHRITIKFSKKVTNPFFRFSLELFSIIPKKCIDLKTDSLVCHIPPTSGHYKLTPTSTNKWSFTVKYPNSIINGKKAPTNIEFIYKDPATLLQEMNNIDSKTVIYGREDQFEFKDRDFLEKKFFVKYLPSSGIVAYQIHSEMKPFDDIKCRHLFSSIFKNKYKKYQRNGLHFESSLFTRMLPGYIEDTNLNHQLTQNDILSCRSKFKDADLAWYFSRIGYKSDLAKALQETVKELGISKFKRVEVKGPNDSFDAHGAKKSFFVHFSTGFWPLDPAGDLQMLFTPNLHLDMNYISNNPELQQLLESLNSETGSPNRNELFLTINKFMFEDGKFNIINHIRNFYVTNKNAQSDNLPLSIKDMSAAPWQIFQVNE
jgi:ABC-type transport system substrate-binding protein